MGIWASGSGSELGGRERASGRRSSLLSLSHYLSPSSSTSHREAGGRGRARTRQTLFLLLALPSASDSEPEGEFFLRAIASQKGNSPISHSVSVRNDQEKDDSLYSRHHGMTDSANCKQAQTLTLIPPFYSVLALQRESLSALLCP